MNGSIVNIGVRSVEVLISVKFKRKENIITQTFEFQTSDKILKFVLDKRFEIYNKTQSKIRDLMLSNFTDKVFYVSNTEDENKIIFQFEVLEEIDKKLLINYYHVVPSFLPPNTGCIFCANYTEEHFCTVKNKTILQPLKKCVVFKQLDKLFKT